MTSRTGNLYRQLGVKRVINARGSTTVVGGSMLSEEVLAAIAEANRHYVEIEELLAKSGQAAAELLETDAALITSGCFAALVLGAASIMAGKDPDKISRLPDTTNMRNEFLLQKKTRLRYARCISVAGGKLIEVGDEEGTTAEDLEAAMGPDTAGILYFAQEEDTEGVLTIPEMVDIAKRNDLPVLIDAAAEVYPLERMTGVVKSGADLVCFSGKYLGSAQSSGILCGRKDLVEAASLNNFIAFEVDGSESFGNAIGRGYKIDRQEIIATVVALREWLTTDHEERFAIQEQRIQTIESALKGLPYVATEHVWERHGHSMHLLITVDEEALGKKHESIQEALRRGDPCILIGMQNESLRVRVHNLMEGEDQVVAERLQQLLSG